MSTIKNKKKEPDSHNTLKLDMSFEEAMKKALTTPLPKKSKKNKKDASK